MAKPQLDTLDYKILKMLSSNGRKPFLKSLVNVESPGRRYISVSRN